MPTTRRELLTALGALPLAAATPAAETPAHIEPLWKSPDGHPNALEAAAEGLWVGERTGRTLRVIALRRGIDPDPHGMTRHDGLLYYSDSGLLNGGGAHGGKYSGYICRLHV